MNTPRDTRWYNNFYDIIKNQLPPPPRKKENKIHNKKSQKTKQNETNKQSLTCIATKNNIYMIILFYIFISLSIDN